MQRIINQTTTRVYENGRWWNKTVTDTVEVPDPTPTPAPVRTLTTNAPACARCGKTGCRCTAPQQSAQTQDDDWMPRTIMNPQGKETQPVTMSAEMRARKAAYDQWDTVFYKCLGHPYFDGLSAELRGCSTQQLLSVFARLERGEVVKEVLDDLQRAWTPKGLLGARKP